VVSFFVPDDAVLVADGGLATELEARGNDLPDSLWSARLLMDAPDEVRDAHLAFFRAGAVIATSASYQASFEGFARRGLDRREAAGLMRRTIDLARAARAEMAGDGQARWEPAAGECGNHAVGRPARGERGEHVPDRGLDLGIGVDHDIAGVVVDQPDGQRGAQLAAPGCGPLVGLQPLRHHVQFHLLCGLLRYADQSTGAPGGPR